MSKISVVINTLNEEKNLPLAIASVKGFADEIVVVDMESSDRTVEVAKRLGAKVFSHKKVGYVEPARNYAVSKAKGNYVFILDADEEVSPGLVKKIKKIVHPPGHPRGGRVDSSGGSAVADYYRIPRKNIIFGKWIKHSRWWPDYNIRFFKKGFVSWDEVIHSIPMTKGKGTDLPEKEEYAIIHNNYSSIEGYLERMSRYSQVESGEMMKGGYVFSWKDLINKPSNEFLSRFFAGEGYKDGIHGLALALLQAFSQLVLYLKVWQKQGFDQKELPKKEIKSELVKALKDIKWWVKKKLTLFGFLLR